MIKLLFNFIKHRKCEVCGIRNEDVSHYITPVINDRPDHWFLCSECANTFCHIKKV